MIKRLKKRMLILVAAVLLLVTAGIVVSINLMNWKTISEQAEAALETLAENSGARPSSKKDRLSSSPEKQPQTAPEDEKDEKGEEDEKPPSDLFAENSVKSEPDKPVKGAGKKRFAPGQPPETEDALAELSNYYVVTLSKDGEIENWTSDRSDLYSDDQVSDFTALALSSGKDTGHIGTQFYSLTSRNGKKLLIVLDERLEIMNAGKVLRLTIIAVSLACMLLCIAAYFLINAMVRPVQDAFDKQKQFVWDASHELKTPLAVIGANANVLQGEIGENEYLGYISSEVKRTDALVRDLLTLARMDQGSVSLKASRLNLDKTVLSVALPFESNAYEAGRTLEMDIQEGISCTGDASMLAQLTVILLSNALKYSDPGGRIFLSVRQKGRSCEIKVSNTGDGISPKDLERIFERFYRADSSHDRSIEGFGLGLCIAKKITDAHDGKIRAESEPCGLTTFTVTLPAV